MSWRDLQGEATFRGVAFRVVSRERGGGRRLAVHEFPFSEAAPYAEDLGAKGQRIPVEGYVAGAEYLTARNALIDALNLAGPGELVHPAHGTVRVAVDGFRVRESTDEGGIARFSIDFVETSGALNPTTSVTTPAAVTAAVTTTRAALSTQFLSDFVRLPMFATSAADALTAMTRAIDGVVAAHDLGAQQVAGLLDTLSNLRASASTLVNSPEATLAGTLAVFDELGSALLESVDRPRQAILSLYNAPLGDRPPAPTPARAIEQQNFDALTELVQRCVLAHASTAIALEVFDSYEAARAARQELVDLIDAHAEATSDDTFPALQGLQAAIVSAVPGEGRDLPHLRTYVAPATVPSLVLAYRLYGSLDREADLIARNRVADPGRIPGGVALEVLSE